MPFIRIKLKGHQAAPLRVQADCSRRIWEERLLMTGKPLQSYINLISAQTFSNATDEIEPAPSPKVVTRDIIIIILIFVNSASTASES